MNADARRALVRFLVSYVSAGGRSDFVERTKREIEEALADDDRRVDDLARRLDRLEEFARLTGLRCADQQGAETLNAVAAAALDREITIDEIADDFVRLVFTNGQGNQAARLELVDGNGRGVGGWGQGPFRDRMLEALRKATPPAAVLEAIPNDDAIDRLALALRATSQWFTALASAPQILGKLAEFLENPEYARRAIKGRS